MSNPVYVDRKVWKRRGLRASLRIGKHLVIIHQMLLIPWILLHVLVVVYALENDLAEAVIGGEVAKLRVDECGHLGAGGALVVNLFAFSQLVCKPS